MKAIHDFIFSKVTSNVILIFAAGILSCHVMAQAPQKISYQSVIRNASNQVVANQQVGMKISILQGSQSGTIMYAETHTPTTNANGLVSVVVGDGTVVEGDISTINWGSGTYFLKSETDPAGGTNYSLTITNQILSVPYALFSGNGLPDGSTTNQLLYWNGTNWVTLNPGNNGQSLTICNGVLTWANGGECPAIGTLDCGSAINNGILTQGTEASGVSSSIPYTGGNGTSHNGQTITSTGVTGLTATLPSGTFSTGNGSVIYGITGTPTSSGIASFAINIGGQSCTLTRTVAPVFVCGLLLTDVRDNKEYPTVQIGDQCWLAENLAYLPVVHSNTQFEFQNSNSLPGYGVYSYNGSDVTIAKSRTEYIDYGVLYNWFAVSQVGIAAICPSGWHVPSMTEFDALLNNYGGSGADAFHALKEGGSSNFDALRGGDRTYQGTFANMGNAGYWWSSTEGVSSGNSWSLNMDFTGSTAFLFQQSKGFGFSVRCLKNN